MTSNMEKNLIDLLQEETELQFSSFTSEDALKIGNLLINKAKKISAIITIDITRHGHQLFHYSFDGTSPDNDEWVKRKIRVVNRFGHSSFFIGQKLKSENTTIEKASLLKESEYGPHGGSFPIIIKNVGPVGTITVSGLAQEEDHKLVIEAIREYL